MFSAIVRKTSKIIQKSLNFQDFLSEMLRRKCSSGNVENSFDNPAKNFPVKMQFFLVKFQKRRKTNFSRVFFWRFSLCTLDYCFDTPDNFFCQNQKKLTQSPKIDDDSINYFCYFFSKFCWGHVKCTFSNAANCHIYFAKRWFFFTQRQKTIKQILSSPKKDIKTFRCTRRLQFWEILAKNSHQKPNNFVQRPRNLIKVSSFERKVLTLFLWTLWM